MNRPRSYEDFTLLLEQGVDPGKITHVHDTVKASFEDMRLHEASDELLFKKINEFWRWSVIHPELRRGELTRNRVLSFALDQWRVMLLERRTLNAHLIQIKEEIAEVREMVSRSTLPPSIIKG